MLEIVFRGKSRIIKSFMLYIYCKLSLYIYVNRILIIIFNMINLILVCLCIINSKAVYKNLLTVLNLYRPYASIAGYMRQKYLNISTWIKYITTGVFNISTWVIRGTTQKKF